MNMPSMKFRLLFSVFMFLVQASSWGQPIGYTEHFTEENGLEQSSILKIIQDKKGFLWLGTFDGLIRYDGYQFQTIRNSSLDSLQIRSNRINELQEDRYGRIWLKSNDAEAYCYDPSLERFWALNTVMPDFALARMKACPSGRVWLISGDDGVVCVTDSLFHTTVYNELDGLLRDNTVFDVHEDSEMNTWLMTSKGLAFISGGDLGRITHLYELRRNPRADIAVLRCGVENDREIWFAGNGGQIWKYDKADRVFYNISAGVGSTIGNLYWLDSQLLLGVTVDNGFFTYNVQNGELANYNSQTIGGLSTRAIRLLYLNKVEKEIWFTNDQPGIYRFRFVDNQLAGFLEDRDKKTPVNEQLIPYITADDNANLWIQPKSGGLHFYDRTTKRIQPDVSSGAIFPNIAYTAFVDHQNNLWFSSRNQGLQKLSFSKQQFRKIAVDNSDVTANNVRALAQDNRGTIWAATKDESKLILFDKQRRKLGYLSPDGRLADKSQASWNSSIYCILQDQQQNIWLGTRGDGIYRFTPALNSLSFRVKHYRSQANDPYSLIDDDVFCMAQDQEGRIWVGTWGGGLNLIEQRGSQVRFLNYKNKLQYPSDDYLWIRCLAVSQDNRLYVGTTNGLVTINLNGNVDESMQYRQYSDFPNHDVLSVYETEKKDFLLATYGGNLYRQTEVTAEGFPVDFEIYSSQTTHLFGGITAILEDDNNRVWLCSERNLVRYTPETGSFETFPEVKKIIGESLFSESSVCKLQGGEMMFGFSKGILELNPQNVGASDFTPYLALTGFELLNNAPETTEEVLTTASIDDCADLELKHNQNFFKIQFAALDFNARKNIQYKYKLEGLEENWNYTGSERTATYTNLSQGTYLFRVSSTNGNGVWVDNERQLKIIVKPSIWETKLAYAIYLLFAIGLFIVVQKTILTIFHLRNDMAMQQKMADLKLRFFTDVSHEIRTPLTMISAPVEKIMNDRSTPEPIRKQLSVVEQSTQRLLKLINQILDLRKLQNHLLKVEKLDLVRIAQQICVEFEELALSKKINLSFSGKDDPVWVWADKECVDKMLVNLVSNALKYCPQGSLIKVLVEETDQFAVMRVADNGPGISKEKQKKLFVRFSNFNDDANNPSTGIGLSLVKDFADKHDATIQLDSEEGRGTAISVNFKKGRDHFGSDVELVSPEREKKEPREAAIPQETTSNSEHAVDGRMQPVGLLVEDDPELRRFMKSLLDDEYVVYEAEDGEQGLQRAKEVNPDFIVSDIMMPNIDGIELLQRLRNDDATSHIPIVLLSAKTDTESKLSGLSHGADDYLTKPFSVSYFKARIANLLEQRQRLQAFFKQSDTGSPIEKTSEELMPLSSKDKAFMDELIQFIVDNMENPEFSVEELGKHMNLAKTTFFNKLKSLSGSSPVEFIREIRLSEAAKILVQENLLVKEACYQVGFSDLKYFGKCFKEKYNLTPAEYRKKNRQVRT